MPRFRVRPESAWKLPAMLSGSRERCENTITNFGSEMRQRSVPPWCGSRRRTRAMPCTFSTCSSRTVSPESGTFTGGAGPEANAAASAQNCSLSYLGDESAARLGDGARALPKEKLWDKAGRKELEGLVLDPWASLRRQELLQLLDQLDPWIANLDAAVTEAAESRLPAVCLMQQAGVGPVTSLAFVLTIGPVSRFANSKKVVSYLGVESQRRKLWRSAAAGDHQQAGKPDDALLAGRSRPDGLPAGSGIAAGLSTIEVSPW